MNSLNAAIGLTRALHGDVKQTVEALNADKESGFWLRAYVRALSGYVEGTVSIYRQMISALHSERLIQLTLEQQLFFYDIDWKVHSKGGIKASQKKVPTKDSLKCIIKELGVILELEDFKMSENWFRADNFYKLRDKVTHPKNMEDIVVNASEVEEAEAFRKWLHECLRLINDCIETIILTSESNR